MSYRNASTLRGPLVVAFNGRVAALERDSGEIRWQHNVQDTSVVRLAITDTRVYAATHFQVFAFDYHGGEELWRTARRHTGAGAIIAEDDKVYVASSGEVECLSESGEHLWNNAFKGAGYGALAMGVAGACVQADLNT
jgi:outer membrane protein assembly factor BamB